MDDVQLSNWYAGHDRQPVEAYRLDDIELARALGVAMGTPVWLSDYTLTKTRLIHKEIDFQDYKKLPEILAEGFIEDVCALRFRGVQGVQRGGNVTSGNPSPEIRFESVREVARTVRSSPLGRGTRTPDSALRGLKSALPGPIIDRPRKDET